MWQGHSVSVVLPTYRESLSIRRVIEDFYATGVVEEVIVVNNNAEPGTSEAVAGTGAREVHEPVQGYGHAIRRGLREAATDYVVVCEPDATFVAGDIFKLLSFADNFDVVYGSRTSQQLLWNGANMGRLLRWGNWAVAKYLELLYNATNLTDVGCTMRLLRIEAARALEPYFTIGGNEFGPEMMIKSLRSGFRVVQIPVNYLPRVGTSSVTGHPVKAVVLGLRMISLITRLRFLPAQAVLNANPTAAERDAVMSRR
jgi:glycosyltransferase involved in cell wall biosynthesis